MREALRSGALVDRDALEVAAQIAEALKHAHGRGIIHRDVKPSNVLLAESDEIDVRLLDFGLAQMAEFDTLTALGDIPGTLAYISPERLQGLVATPAADIWAVGVVLFEALAGEHPFWGGDLVETSRRIQAGAPDLATLRPDLPDHIIRVVAGALSVNPQRRPSAATLADELRSVPKRLRRGGSGSTTRVKLRKAVLTERVLPAALAGLATGWVASRLPFYPPDATLGLAGTAAALGFTAPRAGLAFTLLAAFFPLANISLGLGLLFAGIAVVWLAPDLARPARRPVRRGRAAARRRRRARPAPTRPAVRPRAGPPRHPGGGRRAPCRRRRRSEQGRAAVRRLPAAARTRHRRLDEARRRRAPRSGTSSRSTRR